MKIETYTELRHAVETLPLLDTFLTWPDLCLIANRPTVGLTNIKYYGKSCSLNLLLFSVPRNGIRKALGPLGPAAVKVRL